MLSNFSVEQIKQARHIVPIVSVQNQFNLWHRQPEFDGVLDYCEQEGLIFFPGVFWGEAVGSEICQILKLLLN